MSKIFYHVLRKGYLRLMIFDSNLEISRNRILIQIKEWSLMITKKGIEFFKDESSNR